MAPLSPRNDTGKKSSGFGDVPASAAAFQIVRAAMAPDVSVSDLADLAQSDPAFALRIVALVNSPVFGLGVKTVDVGRAASTIGIMGMRNLALSLALSDLAPTGEGGRLLLGNSIRRAVAARLVAERAKLGQPESHFMTGMLLEVGLLSSAKAQPDLAASLARAPSDQRVLRERAAGLSPHPVRGGKIATDYRLPADVGRAIELHHEPTMPTGALESVAWVAERIAGVFEGGLAFHTQAVALDAMAGLGLSKADAQAVLAELPGLVSHTATSLQRNVGPQPDLDSLLVDVGASLHQLNQEYQALVLDLERAIADKAALTQQLLEANKQLKELALIDGLTGLPNKRAFEEALLRDLAYADRENRPIGLLVLDIDHFKKVNDTFGHQAGDSVLRFIGRLIRSQIRESDTPARWGGEEFAVILRDTSVAGARLAAERIRKALECSKIPTDKGELSVTASVGVIAVLGRGSKERGAELASHADAALYDAKHAGRNRIAISAAATALD